MPKWKITATGTDWVMVTERDIGWPGSNGLEADPGAVPLGEETGAMEVGAAHLTVTCLEVTALPFGAP